MAVPWIQQVEELVTSALVLARSRSGRMAAVNVAVPEAMPQEQIGRLLKARLAACGHPGLEVVLQPSTGALRITSAEFER